MNDSAATRPSLLFRVRDSQDEEAWRQFVDIYAPLVYGFARRQGLQDADAADVTQEVLRAVSVAIGQFEYDAERGSFRTWLYTVARSKLITFLSRRRRQCQGTGDTSAHELLKEQPAPEDADQRWEKEYERRLFTWAAEQVRGSVQDSTWQAFWQTAVEGKSGKEVARQLGLTVAAVYLAKSRVMSRLREQIQQVRDEESIGATHDPPGSLSHSGAVEAASGSKPVCLSTNAGGRPSRNLS
jgi:RNA polymerase sigma-70 factor (ECF subfamily)